MTLSLLHLTYIQWHVVIKFFLFVFSTPASGDAEGQQPSIDISKAVRVPTKEKSDFFANRYGSPIGATKLNKITINRRLTIFAKIHGFVQNSLCQMLAINSSSPQKLPY